MPGPAPRRYVSFLRRPWPLQGAAPTFDLNAEWRREVNPLCQLSTSEETSANNTENEGEWGIAAATSRQQMMASMASPFGRAARELVSDRAAGLELTAGETAANHEDQTDEIVALESIFDTSFTHLAGTGMASPVAAALAFSPSGYASELPFDYELCIDMDCVQRNIRVSICVEEEGGDDNRSSGGDTSGKAWCCYCNVEHLPPIRLRWRYVSTYPSHTAPQFDVQIEWLSAAQRRSVADALLAMYAEASGGCVIFQWADFLRNQVLEHLGLGAGFVLLPSPCGQEVEGGVAAVEMLAVSSRAAAESARPGAGGGEGEGGSSEGRAARDAARVIVGRQLEFDDQMRLRKFQEAIHSCPVCLQETSGWNVTRLDCGDACCNECLAQMARVLITEGTLDSLRCPVPACKATLSRPILRQVAGPQLWQRYEALEKSKMLDRMSHTHRMRFCPQCDPANPAVRASAPASAARGSVRTLLCRYVEAGTPWLCRFGKSCKFAHDSSELPAPAAEPADAMPCFPADDAHDDPLYVCERCGYNFCGDCRRAYHPGVACAAATAGLEQRVLRLEQQAARGRVDAVGQLARARQDLLSQAEISATTRACPACSMGVFKTGGCNHITCLCGAHFCWTCGRIISDANPYDHFRAGGCVVFDAGEAGRQPGDACRARERALNNYRRRVHRVVRQQMAAGARMSECPNCRIVVSKDSTNNHVTCNNCAVSFCFLCRQRLKGIKGHFSPQHPQHSDP